MTMKPFRMLVMMAVMGCSILNAQTSRQAITRVLEDQVEAWNKGNVEGYMTGYWKSDSTSFVSGGSVMHGYDAVLARYRKNYDTREKMGTLSFSDLNITVLSPDAAVVTGAWKLVRTNDQPGGRFTLIFRKKPAGWRIVYDHTSSAP